MARQDQANDRFSVTSFLYGGNADYIEQLQANYERDPASVDPEWRDFFAALKDDADDVRKNAKGASAVGTPSTGLAEFEISRPWMDDATAA